jgi:hypothetical protein
MSVNSATRLSEFAFLNNMIAQLPETKTVTGTEKKPVDDSLLIVLSTPATGSSDNTIAQHAWFPRTR